MHDATTKIINGTETVYFFNLVFTLEVVVPNDVTTSVAVQYVGTDGPQLSALRLKDSSGCPLQRILLSLKLLFGRARNIARRGKSMLYEFPSTPFTCGRQCWLTQGGIHVKD